MSLLEVKSVRKVYTTKFANQKVEALHNVSFTIEEGEYVAIMGESGSGKTTLLNILAALDKPTSGEVLLDGKNIILKKDKEISEFRRNELGFVFQDFNLLDTFSIRDNIFLPLVLSKTPLKVMEESLEPLVKKLEIEDILGKFPYEVSGGEKQRTAVARALITGPRLVLADEPTGSLDSKASTLLLSLFEQINNDGQTIFMVTHSANAASHAKRILFIKDGEIYHQLYRSNLNKQEFYQTITDTLNILNAGGVING